MPKLGLETEVADQEVFENTLQRFREAEIALPTFAELADPTLIPETIQERLTALDPDRPHPLNLFRVHWYNDAQRTGQTDDAHRHYGEFLEHWGDADRSVPIVERAREQLAALGGN